MTTVTEVWPRAGWREGVLMDREAVREHCQRGHMDTLSDRNHREGLTNMFAVKQSASGT